MFHPQEAYKDADDLHRQLTARSPNEPEFHQAVHEVVHSLWDFLKENPKVDVNLT